MRKILFALMMVHSSAFAMETKELKTTLSLLDSNLAPSLCEESVNFLKQPSKNCLAEVKASFLKGHKPTTANTLAKKACLGSNSTYETIDCLKRVDQWVQSSVPKLTRTKIAVQSCSGGSSSSSVAQCLNNVFNWVNNDVSPDHARQVASIACARDSDETTHYCMMDAWQVFSEVADNNQRRLKAAEYCQGNKDHEVRGTLITVVIGSSESTSPSPRGGRSRQKVWTCRATSKRGTGLAISTNKTEAESMALEKCKENSGWKNCSPAGCTSDYR